MKKVAFIANIYHSKSASSNYITQTLEERFTVKRFPVETWDGVSLSTVDDINKGNYDIVIFFQNYPNPEILQKLNQKNIVWLPMYDTEIRKKPSRYLKLHKHSVKILSFSKKLHEILRSYGLDVEYAQLYIKPLKRLNQNNKNLKVFFWPRVEKIDWPLVKRLLGSEFKGEVVVQNVPDPNNTFKVPPKEDVQKYNIQFITEWIPFEEILKIRSGADIFIAPREYEGIGLTYLEAMAAGLAVVSPNSSTMNEYIRDGYNGYLYSLDKDIQPLNFKYVQEVKENAYISIQRGYGDWQSKKKVLFSICERKYIKNKSLLRSLKTGIYLFILQIAVSLKKRENIHSNPLI